MDKRRALFVYFFEIDDKLSGIVLGIRQNLRAE